MIVSCTQCQMKFKVDDAKIGPRGVKVRCIRCQTMIIVKPPGSDPLRDTQPMASPPVAADQEVPTRVLQLDPAARAALAQAAKGAAPASLDETRVISVGGSFGLDPSPAPPGQQPTLPPLPAFSMDDPTALDASERTTVAPPPRPGPPPLKKPASSPVAAEADEPVSDDLFSDPFGTAPAPAPVAERFMDAGSEGPALELDMPAPQPKAPPPEPAPAADPLADLPRFDASDDGPQFEGGMSAEGQVTKPVQVGRLEGAPNLPTGLSPSPARQAPAPIIHESVTVPRRPPPEKPKSTRSVFLRVGQVVVTASIMAGYAGLYLLWQAGGVDAFTGRAQGVRSGALSLQHIVVAPFLSADGSAFWVVRGEAHNRGIAPLANVQVNVALQGHTPVHVPLDAEPDAAKLFSSNEIVVHSTASDLAPEQRLPFTAVVPVARGSAAPPEVEVSPFAGTN